MAVRRRHGRICNHRRGRKPRGRLRAVIKTDIVVYAYTAGFVPGSMGSAAADLRSSIAFKRPSLDRNTTSATIRQIPQDRSTRSQPSPSASRGVTVHQPELARRRPRQ